MDAGMSPAIADEVDGMAKHKTIHKEKNRTLNNIGLNPHLLCCEEIHKTTEDYNTTSNYLKICLNFIGRE